MKITLSNETKTFNRATRQYETREEVCGSVRLPDNVYLTMRGMIPLYRSSFAELVLMALSFYFGDGKNHLICESCEYCHNGVCDFEELENWVVEKELELAQTTVPLLDKGTVVVGLPLDDLGKREGAEDAKIA